LHAQSNSTTKYTTLWVDPRVGLNWVAFFPVFSGLGWIGLGRLCQEYYGNYIR